MEQAFWRRGSAIATSVAVDTDGSVVIVGSFNGSITFDVSGTPLWSNVYDVGAGARPSVAVGSGGRIHVAGALRTPADFGDGPLPLAGGVDVFLLTLLLGSDFPTASWLP